jgi:TonB-dependent receptor
MRTLVCSLVWVAIIISVARPISVNAQQSPGRINGAVTDASGAVLPGATVVLEEKGLRAVSDAQGQFSIPVIAPGIYTLKVSYVGFSTFETPVTVVAGQPSNVSAVLTVGSDSESVIVTAERAHGEAEAINEEKIADNILNVLPSEVITSLPNANIADAVGRLPGVTLERDEGEGKYVQIRGTEPRLANLTIDGVEVPSPEGGVRQVKLDTIPADLIESVQINKTLQANMNGDAIGGSVNLVTKKAGDRPNVTLSGAGGFTPIIDTRKVYEFGAIAGQRFGAQKRLGLMISGSYDFNGRGIDDVEPAPWQALCLDSAGNCVPNGQTGTKFIPDITSAAIREYLYDRKRYGFGVSADYRLSDSTNLYVHGLFSKFNDHGHRFEYVLNTNDGPNPGSPPNLNPPSCNVAPYIPCVNVAQFTTEIRSPIFQVASLSVGANHVFGTSLINWQFAVGRAAMKNPIGGGESHTQFNYSGSTSNCQYDPSATTNPYYPVFTQACFDEAYNPANMVLNQIQASDHGKAAQLNLEATISGAKNYHIGSHTSTLEAGFYIRNAHKFDDSYEVDYTPSTTILATPFVTNFHNSNYYGGHYQYGPGISWEGVNAYLAANPNQFTSSTQIPNSNNFDLVERVIAGYIMNSLDFSRFRVVAGVRFEGTQDRTLSFDNNAGTLTIPGQGSYIDVLPSVSLRMRLDSKNDSALRFVYARGLSRPDPVFLTTATNIDNSTTPPTVTIGNPALKPEHANNIDVLYERYLTPLGSIQAGFFYKNLTDPIVTLLSGPGNLPQCPSSLTNGCYLSQAANSGGAHIAGFEIAFQQHLSYLPGLLSGLGISANYSYATSQATNVNPGFRIDNPALLRQAPSTWNISPTYDRGRVSLRVGMAYNGANIFSYFYATCLNGEPVNSSGVCQTNPNTPPISTPEPFGVKGPLGDVYLYSHFQVDAQGSVYLGKGLRFTASGLNLNNEVFGFYQGSPQFPIQREFYKPTYSFGLRWELGREK